MKKILITFLLILLSAPVYSWDQRYEEEEKEKDDVTRMPVHGSRISFKFRASLSLGGRAAALPPSDKEALNLKLILEP